MQEKMEDANETKQFLKTGGYSILPQKQVTAKNNKSKRKHPPHNNPPTEQKPPNDAQTHSRTQQYEWENWTLTSLRKAVALTWLISFVSWDRIVTPMMQCSTLSWGRDRESSQQSHLSSEVHLLLGRFLDRFVYKAFIFVVLWLEKSTWVIPSREFKICF